MLDNQELAQEVISIISKKVKIDPNSILPSTKLFEDIGICEMQLIEIIIALETQFNCHISDQEIELMETFADIHKSLVESLHILNKND